MNRIIQRFEDIKKENKKAFISYICAGDGGLDTTEKIVYALEEAGVDVIELGVPFSDPLADGVIIQEADIRSLSGGFRIENYFNTIRNIRKNSQIPLVSMVYYSSIMGYGTEKYINECVESGIDGLIIPDLPAEEYDEIQDIFEKTDLCLIPLVAITSGNRIPKLVKNAKGFIYCVSSLGVTGERKAFDKRVDSFVESVKKCTDVPACIGFGISTNEDVKRFNKVADGCIVGSAIVRTIFESGYDMDKLKAFVSVLKG